MSAQLSSPRTLAPAPLPLTNPSEGGAASPGAPSNTQTTGIRRASTACQSCKQIKRKCDQAQPCSNCRKTNTHCIYNEADDGRRKAARKRTVESLELKRDALDSILGSLRTSDDSHVKTLVHLIRSYAPLEDIIRYATAHAESIPRKQLQTISTVVNGQPRKTVLSVNDLCETPLVRVPARPWTDVTADNEFISHLISIYFTWYHVAYPIVDKDSFLRDMEAGSLQCHFCSPLLVNAMLTMACQFSDHPRACKIPSNSVTRGKHFLEEASRLWDEQGGRPNLLNIQAVSILAVSSTLVGRDRLSWSYIEQMNRMQQELLFKNAQAEARGKPLIPHCTRRSLDLSSWTCFLLTVGYGVAFMKPPMVEPPEETDAKFEPLLDQSLTWLPYPKQSPETSIAFNDLFKAYCSLHKIGFSIQQLHFGSNSDAEEPEVRSLEQRLQTWRNNLPESLVISDGPRSITKPPVMDLYLTYHWFRNILFNFFRTSRSLSSTHAQQATPDQYHARAQTLESAKAIADLCKLYAQSFGLKQLTIWMPQSAISAAHSLIDELSNLERGAIIHDIFHELCVVIVAASQRWLVMKGHARMLFVTAEEKGHTLPQRTKDLLKFVALDKWGESDHLQFASASYPNYALAKEEDPRLAAMGDLLEKWAGFRTGEEKEEAVVENAHALIAESRTTSESVERITPKRSESWRSEQ